MWDLFRHNSSQRGLVISSQGFTIKTMLNAKSGINQTFLHISFMTELKDLAGNNLMQKHKLKFLLKSDKYQP
jgi:hypothetical protein